MTDATRVKFSGAELRAYRAQSWIRQAERIDHRSRETDRDRRGALDDRFIAYWIALNALYGQARYRGREGSERADLRRFLEFIRRTPLFDKVRSELRERDTRLPLEKLLGDAFLVNENWALWDADRILDADQRRLTRVAEKDRDSELFELFSRLYVLRTQLFHGCAVRGSSSKGKTMAYAVTLLQKVVPLFAEATKRHGTGQAFLAEPPYPPSEPPTQGTRVRAPFNPVSIASGGQK